MPMRANLSFVKEREFERDRQLAAGELRVAPSQDPKELVRLGYRISPAFFVPKDKAKTSGPEWEATAVEQRIEMLRLVANLKRMNKECVKKTCKFEGLGKIRSMSRRGLHTHVTTADVRHGFKCLELHRNSQYMFCLDLGSAVRGHAS
jgi:hypothetical protein